MHHYVALMWDRRNAAAADEAEQLARSIAEAGDGWINEALTSGLILLRKDSTASFQTYLLPQGCGCVIGCLFRHTEGPPATADNVVISADEARSFVSSDGRALTEDFWGGYVAFLQDAGRGVASVIRDCSGRVPCYWFKRGAIDVFFSDICDVSHLLPSPTIDWMYLSAFVVINDMQIRRTALVGVTELLAGDVVTLTPTGTRHECHWSPERVWDGERIDDYALARVALRRAVATCVHSWAAMHANVVHSLSGGFDSALVLGWLARAAQRPRITCLNRFAISPQEDERHYARLAARHAGVELIEAEWRAGDRRLSEVTLTTPKSAKPAVPALWAMLDVALRNEITERFRASAISTGQGGDHLFLYVPDPVAASDYLLDYGIRPQLLKVVDETARISRTSFWDVARKSFSARYARKRVATTTFAPYRRYFISRDALPNDLADYVSHPWVLASDSRSPGRQLQARAIANLTNRHRPLGDMEHAEELHPLISQPLIECCLRIPSYLHLRGGRRRALAKDAFAPEVPEEITRRADKGSIVSVTVGMIRESRTFLREALLGGILAQEHLLDIAELEPILKNSHPIRSDQIYPLLACIAAETWARTWRSPGESCLPVRTADVRVA